MLFVGHNVLSSMTGIAELALDQAEAQDLGKATGEVMSHYDITFLDDKTTAWINLGQTLFGLYGTRFMALRIRKAAERQEAMARAAAAAREVHASASPSAPATVPTNVYGPDNAEQRS